MGRDLLLIGGGRLATALVALVSVRLSTAMLPVEQYGILAMLTTFQSFCGLFLVNPVGQYINRYTHSWADDGSLLPRLYRYRVWVIVAALSGAIVSGIWTLSQHIDLSAKIQIMIVVSVMVMATTWNSTSVSLLNMLGYRAQSVAWASCSVFFSLALSYVFVTVLKSGSSWFAGQALGVAIGAIGSSRALRKILPTPAAHSIPLLEPHALSRYIFPLALSTALMWWLLSGYRLLIEAHWGLVALGYATVGLMLSSQLWGVAESLATQYLFPLFYRRISSSSPSDSSLAYSDLLNTLGPIYLVLLAASLLGAPFLLKILVDKAYAAALPFLFLGSVVECCRAIGNLLSTGAQIKSRMASLIPAYATGAVIVTLGIVFTILGRGSVHLAISVLVVAGFVVLIVMVHQMRLLSPFTLDIERWLTSFALVVVCAITAFWFCWIPHELGEALMALTPISILTLLSVLALLRNNPATERLLVVKLHPRR